MKYQIFYTDLARQDLKNIHRYISESLVEPEIAAKLTNSITAKLIYFFYKKTEIIYGTFRVLKHNTFVKLYAKRINNLELAFKPFGIIRTSNSKSHHEFSVIKHH